MELGRRGYSSLCDYCLVSCSPSRMKLSGYPVREIEEVLIDGDVVDPSQYTLWKRRYVTRLDGGHWPYQQNLTLPDTDDGTFSITYTYGADPPDIGMAAAAQLGCEIYRACETGSAGRSATCRLASPASPARGSPSRSRRSPPGATSGRTARLWQTGGWKTGLPLVDAFLNAYNQAGIMRRPTFWSPGKGSTRRRWDERHAVRAGA